MINAGVVLDSRGGLSIGNDVEIANDVRILSASHDVNDVGFAYVEKSVQVADRVWIATGALVLPGVALASGSVIGAGSVVTRSTSPDSISVGNPAKAVGLRSRDAQTSHQTVRRFMR